MASILILSKFFPPFRGGIETVVGDHVKLLCEQGHSVTVLSYNKNKSTIVENLDNQTKIIRCAPIFQFKSQPISLEYFKFALKIETFDIIILHEPNPAMSILYITKNFTRSKLVVFWHSDVVKPYKAAPVISYLQRIVISKSTKVITTSQRLITYSKVLAKINQDKLRVSPLWCKDPLDCAKEIESFFDQKEYDFIFIGRPTYYKGFNILLEAMSAIQNKEIKIAVIGFTENDSKEKFSRNDDSRMQYFGDVSDEIKTDLLRKSKFLLFPSTENSEAFGVSQIEALANGVPVINTDLKTGVPWVSIDGETGITVKVGDVNSLAEAMQTAIHMNERDYKSLSFNARERFETKFSSTVCGPSFLHALFN